MDSVAWADRATDFAVLAGHETDSVVWVDHETDSVVWVGHETDFVVVHFGVRQEDHLSGQKQVNPPYIHPPLYFVPAIPVAVPLLHSQKRASIP